MAFYVHFVPQKINPLTQTTPIRGRTAPLTSKRCILYIYSTNIGTEYFKHGIYYPFLSSSKCTLFHNSNVFGSCVIHILHTGCAKIKKNNSGAKRLIRRSLFFRGWMWTLGVHITVVCFIILTYLVPALFTFYIQGVLKLKKNNSGAKMLMRNSLYVFEIWQKIVRENICRTIYNKKMFNWRTKSIRIISNPDNQIPY